jgi:hypothetical protein
MAESDSYKFVLACLSFEWSIQAPKGEQKYGNSGKPDFKSFLPIFASKITPHRFN